MAIGPNELACRLRIRRNDTAGKAGWQRCRYRQRLRSSRRISRRRITAEELHKVECNACPGPGSCGGMYTANTMAAAAEAMGMSLAGFLLDAAVSARRRGMPGSGRSRCWSCSSRHLSARYHDEAGLRERHYRRHGAWRLDECVPPSDGDRPCRGSRADLRRFRTHPASACPHLADLKPSGKYVMEDLNRIGGVQGVMKLAARGGLLHGDC